MLLDTQAENSLTAAAGTPEYGAGGIGEVALFILATARCPSVCPGYAEEAARSAASESSETGALLVGGEPWHPVQ
jgi:hypothetical protein